MKKTKIIKILLVILLLIFTLFMLTGCGNNNNDMNNTNSNTGASKISTDVNLQSAENRISNIIASANEISQVSSEEEVSSYSTQIKDKSSGRLTNIGITCNTLNGTVIKPGDTFSFNQIIGKPTAEKGYQEATVIIDHKTEKGIGGGNCQVSSTLYNAVLNIPELQIVERHEHGKDVTYVPEGKDAAVSYGSLDLKFKNTTNYSVRIDAATDNQSITIKLIKI